MCVPIRQVPFAFFIVSPRLYNTNTYLVLLLCRFPTVCWLIRKQKSKQDIDKPKVQSLEDILKELDEDEMSDEEQEAERRMEELLAGELVRAW